MKRRDLIKRLEKAGFIFVRHGGKHDVYKRGNDEEQVPRHTEINEMLAVLQHLSASGLLPGFIGQMGG